MAKTKTYAALTSEKHRTVMESALPSGSLLYSDPNPDVAHFLADQAEKHTDVVVIDDAGMPYKDVSEHDVYTFPSTQSSNGHHVQIIFIPAATRVAGDAFITDLISVGIYDIVDPHTKDLKKAIEKMAKSPSVFGDAQAWLTDKVKVQNPTKKSSSTGLFGSLRKKKKAVNDEDAAVFLETKTENVTDAEATTPAATKPKVERTDASSNTANADIERLRAEIHAANSKKKESADNEAEPVKRVETLRESISNTTKPTVEKPVVETKTKAKAVVPIKEPTKVEVKPNKPKPTPKETTDGMTIEQLNELVNSRVQKEVLAQLKQQMRAENQKRIAVAGLTEGAGSTTFACSLAAWIAKEVPSKRVVCCMADTETLARLARGAGSKDEHSVTLFGVTFTTLDTAFPEGDIAIFDCGSIKSQEVTTAYELSHKQYVLIDGSPMCHEESVEALKATHLPESTIWVIRNATRAVIGQLASKAKIKMPRQRVFNAAWGWSQDTIPNMEYFAGDIVRKPKTKPAQEKAVPKKTAPKPPIDEKHARPMKKNPSTPTKPDTKTVEDKEQETPEMPTEQEKEVDNITPANEAETGVK